MHTLATQPPHPQLTQPLLPPDDSLRLLLHNEVHARPPARIRLPAWVTYVAVLNQGVSRAQELSHLQALPGQAGLTDEDVQGHFLRLRMGDHTVKWERHTEFTRYSIVQSLPEGTDLEGAPPDASRHMAVATDWLRSIPGRTVVAIQLTMLVTDLSDPDTLLPLAQTWLGGRNVAASQMGGGHSWVVTDFHVGPDGFERMLVLAPPGTTQTRAGRISMRVLELETYRLMALRGFPVAKQLGPQLAAAEAELATITANLEGKGTSEEELLDRLIGLAARVERAIAEHSYRFSATRAYDALVQQRIEELREKAIPGTQTLGEFMRRRLSPAMATVASTEQRLSSLSERVFRASALLRTRVDIATEGQNQQLLEKLTRGQELQLRLQSTVEGLSIAAISYYVVSLLLYGFKSLKAAGLPVHPEFAAGACIPVVLWGVWRTTRRIHEKLHNPH